MRKALVLFCLSGIVTGPASADPANLEGGVPSAPPDRDGILR